MIWDSLAIRSNTQTIESLWSIIKRGVVGTFHKVSKKYLPLYVAEFQFRYNNRENADIFGQRLPDAEIITAPWKHQVLR